jgi:hypothetical protein
MARAYGGVAKGAPKR